MPEEIKKMYTIDENGNRVNVRTIAEAVTNAAGDTLENVEAGAQVNKIEKIKIAGQEVTIVNKAVDLNVYTKTETDTAIAQAVAGASHLKRTIVTELPDVSEADENTIYMILKSSGKNGNKYDEYFVVSGEFEKIGDTEVDLTDYAKTADVNTALAAKADSTDLTSHTGNGDIHVTASDKTTWNGKQDAINDLATIRSGAAAGATAVQPTSLAAVATSGSYEDLTNKPTIPTLPTNILRYAEVLE